MKMKKMLGMLLATSMFLVLVGCSNTDSGKPDTNKIGMVGPLEGDLSVYGIAVHNGVDMAINDFNAANGTNYELIAYDTKGDNTQAVHSYNKLVDEDEVIAIVGGVVSGESIAIASASQSNQTVIISPSATAADFAGIGPNIFRGCYTDPYQAKIVAEFSYDTLGAKTAAILYNTGSDYAKGLTQNFTKAFEDKGGKVVISEGYADGDVDFNTQLTKIVASNPDVFFVPNYYQDNALISKQAKDAGITSTIVGGDGWDGILSSVENPDIVEDVIFVNHYSPDDQTVAALAKRYLDAYGVEVNAFGVSAYDTTTCLLKAIEEAGTHDSQDIINVLNDIQFDGVLGHMEFDDNGEPIKDLSYITIKDGAYVTYGK